MHSGHTTKCVIFIQAFSTLTALKIVMLDVPSPTSDGESVELTCSYDLEEDRLYSVKWYKNGYEFYRYVPKDWPPAQYLKMAGIKGDVSRSDQNRVYLRYVDLNSAGRYRCEISAEAPSFNTAAAEKDMQVYVLPSEGPRAVIEKNEYKPGDIIHANCTSAKSKPAATLNWFINEEPISSTEHHVEYSTTLHSDGLETSSLALRFRAQSKHFKDHLGLHLKCTSSIPEVSTLVNEATFLIRNALLEAKRPTGSPGRLGENLSQVRGSSATILPSIHSLLWSYILALCVSSDLLTKTIVFIPMKFILK